LANVSAKMVDGTKTLFSIVLMVLRDTFANWARSAWVRPLGFSDLSDLHDQFHLRPNAS